MGFRMDPKKQFSKRLARWTAVFWFAYMTWLSILMMLEPTAAQYAMYMGIVVTVVMIVNVVSYTRNSIMEKMAFTLLDKVKIEMSAKGGKTDPAEPEEEGGENG